MKAKNPNHYFGSPNMTETEVNEFLEDKMREEFGPQAELLIQITRITRQFMADQEVAKVQPARSNK